MDSAYNVLNRFLKASNRSGINEDLAKFMLSNLDAIPFMKLADIAEKCHVSTPSVIRFCRELGYEDYTDFKENVIDYWRNPSIEKNKSYSRPDVSAPREEYEAAVRVWLGQQYEYNARALMELDRDQVVRLAEDIMNYRHVYILGMGLAGLVAENIRLHLAQMGKIVITLAEPKYNISLTSDSISTLGIVITQHGRLLNNSGGKLLKYLNENCARTWIITQEPKRKREFPVSEVLRVRGGEHMEEEYHTMFYFETLLVKACEVIDKKSK